MEVSLARSLQNPHESWFEEWFKKAEDIYRDGKHAGAYANLHLTEPLDRDVVLPDPVTTVYANDLEETDTHSYAVYELNVVGATDSSYGTPIRGIVRTKEQRGGRGGGSLKKGTDTLSVRYPEGSMCDPNGIRDGCFAGPEGGAILEGYGAVDYRYDPDTDNRFAYSLKGYSEEEGLRMYYCEHHGGCGKYQEYQHYFDYYGVLDYGNHWIESAFGGTGTGYLGDSRLANGNVDFSVLSKRARIAAIRTATVTLNIFTAVNRLMVEHALDGCRKNRKDSGSHDGNTRPMDSVIDAWDRAVATYAGSELFRNDDDDDEGSESNTTGSLYYSLVDELARDFGVLGPEASPHTSTVNGYIMDEFVKGKSALLSGDCDDMGGLPRSYYMIIHKMRTPWIQGLLRASFVLSAEEDYFDERRREEERGKGAAFLAALLPDLHTCGPQTARSVHELFHVAYGSNRRPDYHTIRELLEQHYECLGVTCDDVGGFLNHRTGDYYPGTHACGGYGNLLTHRRDSAVPSTNQQASPPSSASRGIAVSSFFGVSLVAFVASLAVLVAVVRDHAVGRPVSIAGAVHRLASGAVGTADYWLLSRNRRGRRNGGGRYRLHRNTTNLDDAGDEYNVQLRSLGEPLQPPHHNNDNNNDENNEFVL